MYGGSGISPSGSPSTSTSQRPSPRASRRRTGPTTSPERRRLDGRTSASQVPLSSTRSTRSTSTAPPDARRRFRRAGTTRVSFTTTSSPPSTSGRSATVWVLDRAGHHGDRRATATRPGARSVSAQPARPGGRTRGARCPSGAESSLAPMDTLALERAKQRIAEAAAGTTRAGRNRGRT